MSNIFDSGEYKIDSNKMVYDLSLIYAKSKLDESIRQERFNGIDAPVEIEQMEYLADKFFLAYEYYTNMDDSEVETRLSL